MDKKINVKFTGGREGTFAFPTRRISLRGGNIDGGVGRGNCLRRILKLAALNMHAF